jgi:hypothetical protein
MNLRGLAGVSFNGVFPIPNNAGYVARVMF